MVGANNDCGNPDVMPWHPSSSSPAKTRSRSRTRCEIQGKTNRKQWQGPERDPGGASIPSVVSQLIIESEWASPLSSLSGMGRSEQNWTRLTPVMGGTAVAIVMASQIDSEVLRGVLFVGGGRGEKRKKGKLREKLKFQ